MSPGRESLARCYGRPRTRYWRLRCRDAVRACRARLAGWAALDRSPGDMALSYGVRAVVAGLLGTLGVALALRAVVTGAVALVVAPHPWLLLAVNAAVTAGALGWLLLVRSVAPPPRP